MAHKYEVDMTFDEFLELVRKEIGNYCSTAYWRWRFSLLKEKNKSFVKKELPYLAVHAIAMDYSTRNRH